MTSARNNIKAHEYPAIVDGNLSFCNAVYRIEHKKFEGEEGILGRAGMILEHHLENAGLVAELVRSEDACYACAISSPKSGHREFHMSTTGYQQELQWDIENYGEPPCFTPMVVARDDISEIRLSSEKHNVHDVWNEAVVKFPKGARLAEHTPFRLIAQGISGMVEFVLDKEIQTPGTLKAIPAPGQNFLFKVHCHKDLFTWVQGVSRNSLASENISPLVVAACLAILKNEYSSDDSDEDGGWKTYNSLWELKDFLEQRNCGHWSDDDFDPLEAATKLYSYQWPSESDTDV